ncbi:oocyte zinc finger protein XlCOF22-like isoform X3 [Sphaeramia orbicularis]|uniref:oocyte zinc finger protein XlCOF22-like isoform X3 n=1 Tax=Sphaeramia orbicularis TaxID=375764 RepID=UPI00117DA882|nr:oocyte zinc finger protein XlCOF22-like isoform X3 [Sphaeramia orbicularis]
METNCVSDKVCVEKKCPMPRRVQILRSLVEQRLSAAAEEIFGLFERTIAEYEEELCRTKEENQRQSQILDTVWNQKDLMHKKEKPSLDQEDSEPPTIKEEQAELWTNQEEEEQLIPASDIHQVLVVKEEVPFDHQDWSPCLDQNQEDPEPPHIKEEPEELWTKQEADIIKSSPTPVPVKSEDDEEEAQSSQLHQRQTEVDMEEPDGEDCGSEPFSSFHPHGLLQTQSDDEATVSLESDDSLNFLPTQSDEETTVSLESGDSLNGDCWKDVCEHQSGTKSPKKTNRKEVINTPGDKMEHNDFTVTDAGCEMKNQCLECGKIFGTKSQLMIHIRIHTGEKPFDCSVCGKKFTQKSNLLSHMKLHTGEKSFSCFVCGKRFAQNSNLINHVKMHTEQKAFCCSECGKKFAFKSGLIHHMKCHTGEKPFSCSVCQKSFIYERVLRLHMVSHTGEKAFACSECGKKFGLKSNLLRHMKGHTGQKPYSCSVCQKQFRQKSDVQIHMKIHTREKTTHSGAEDDK